jgi:hypothetical protein
MRRTEPGRPRRTWLRRAALTGVLVALTGFLSIAAVSALAAQTTAPRTVHVWATYYGWFDNTPPGCATSYSGCAGGRGTYADPITFASSKAEFPVGTILYYPTVHKYFRMGDSCQECTLDWKGHGPDGGPHMYHVDLWIGGKGGNAFDAINCEDALTKQTAKGDPVLSKFVVDPADNLTVSSAPLFNVKTGRCFGGAKASSTTGTYRNRSTKRCLAVSAPGHRDATTTACGDAADRIVFNGAFLMHDKRCLKTSGSRDGSQMVWARCDGDANEQWEINPNGTITWMQYTRCVADKHRRIVMTACTSSPTERWAFTSVHKR